MPGETLTSFFEGINKLCGSKAECIMPYPFPLLVNTKFYERRKEYGIVTKRAPVLSGEVDLVISTNDVSYLEYQEGLYFSFALYLLYNVRGLYYTANYLDQKKLSIFSNLFRSFARFCKKNNNLPIIEFHERSLKDFSYYQFTYSGKILYYALHCYRDDFDEILYKFCSEQVWWNDEDIRALFEIDLINRPFVFSTTSLQKKNKFKHLKIKDILPDGYIVDVPVKYHDFIHNFQGIKNYDDKSGSVLKIKSIDKQFPFMEVKSIEEHADYCHGLMINIRNILPVWSKI